MEMEWNKVTSSNDFQHFLEKGCLGVIAERPILLAILQWSKVVLLFEQTDANILQKMEGMTSERSQKIDKKI